MTTAAALPRRRLVPSTRWALAGAAVLLAVSLVAPLWVTRMEAPQYRGEEALQVRVYAGRVTGDIHEINLLNQYVGVHLPLDTPELHGAAWMLGVLLALALAGTALPAPRRRRALARTLLGTMLVVAAGGFALLQYRLWQMGHVRERSALVGVPDFTPPVIGSEQIANFTAHMSIGWGGWAYAAALLLVAWVAWSSRRQAPGPAAD